MKMDWRKLLSKKRLYSTGVEGQRPPFQRDFDRITFSSAFRRLQDKTQVFPLAESDYVRTRLTHSIETSCVARSLGSIVGEKIIKRHSLSEMYKPSDFGAIVAAASLAHDIGNPPLGHSGEDAVQYWFRTSILARDFLSNLNPDKYKKILKDKNAVSTKQLAHTVLIISTGRYLIKNAWIIQMNTLPSHSL